MKPQNTLLVLLLVCLPLLSACDVKYDADWDFGSTADKAIDEASRDIDKALATENISVSQDSDSDAPEAEITPQGDLLIEGRKVAITAEHRTMLLEYRGQITGIAGDAAAIGLQSAQMATKAVSMALKSAFTGESDDTELDIKAETKKIATLALKLCDRLPAMRATQQQLATRLPEFKPYATMTAEDVEDCHHDSKVELE